MSQYLPPVVVTSKRQHVTSQIHLKTASKTCYSFCCLKFLGSIRTNLFLPLWSKWWTSLLFNQTLQRFKDFSDSSLQKKCNKVSHLAEYGSKSNSFCHQCALFTLLFLSFKKSNIMQQLTATDWPQIRGQVLFIFCSKTNSTSS